jgi:DNA-binding transcriptional LysR family regulator
MAYTLRQIGYAVAVTDSGSITEAAQRIGVSQPAISAALKHLESEFGISIFVRRPAHRIDLTPAGQRFISTARRLLEDAREFENEARGLGRDIEGTIEVGCFLPTAPFIMPLLLRPLRDRYPGITVNLHEAHLGELNEMLKDGTIEVALMYDQQPDRQVQFEPLIEAPPYVLLSAKDPLAKEAAVSLAALAEKDMVLLDLPVTQQYFQSLFYAMARQPTLSFRPKSYEMVRSLVAAGVGFSLLIMRPISNQAYDGARLACRPIADPIPHPHYGLAMAKQTMPSAAVRAFADECRRILKHENAAAKFYVRGPARG